MLLFNSIPVFAADPPINNTNTSDKAEYWKEPHIGYMTDETEASSYYYLFEKLDVSYTWLNGAWQRAIKVYGTSLLDFNSYFISYLPKIGLEGQCDTFTFYIYMGEGLSPGKVLTKISELGNKINSNHEN